MKNNNYSNINNVSKHKSQKSGSKNAINKTNYINVNFGKYCMINSKFQNNNDILSKYYGYIKKVNKK